MRVLILIAVVLLAVGTVHFQIWLETRSKAQLNKMGIKLGR